MGRRIREARISMSLNQKDFAKIGDVGITTQQQYEAGKTSPTAAYLYNLEAAGVDIGYLLTGKYADGQLSFKDAYAFELLGVLSDREQEAVMAMLMVLAGRVSDASDPLQSAPMVHASGREYKGMKEGE